MESTSPTTATEDRLLFSRLAKSHPFGVVNRLAGILAATGGLARRRGGKDDCRQEGFAVRVQPDRNKRDAHEHNIGKSRLCVLLWIGKARQGEPRKFTEVWIVGMAYTMTCLLSLVMGLALLILA